MTREELLKRYAAGERNFRRANLTNVNLTDATLANADLAGANLTNADMRGVTLTDANLMYAKLAGATLTDANLTGAKLTVANLANANLTGAKLTVANLANAELANATLTDADLTGAALTDANLANANLTGAKLTVATLTDAYLTGAKLTVANLTNAELANAHLAFADLAGAKLAGAALFNADLTGVTGLPSPREWCAANLQRVEGGYEAFKVFGAYYTPNPAWNIRAGSVLEEPDYHPDRRMTCAAGINCAPRDWLTRQTETEALPAWRIFIADADIDAGDVCVPYATDGKFRARRITLIKLEDSREKVHSAGLRSGCGGHPAAP